MDGNMPAGNLPGDPSVAVEEAASAKNAVSEKPKYANRYTVEENIYGFVVIPTLKGGSSVLMLFLFYVTVITISTIITLSVVEEYNETSDALDKVCDLEGEKYDCRPPGYSKFAHFSQLDTDDDGMWSLMEARNAHLLQQFLGLHDVVKQTPELQAVVTPPRQPIADEFCFIYFGNQATISTMNKAERLQMVKSAEGFEETMTQECAGEEEGCLLTKLCPNGQATLERPYRSSSEVYMDATTSSAIFPKHIYSKIMDNVLPVCRLVEPDLCGNAQTKGVLAGVNMWASLDPEQRVSVCKVFVKDKCPVAFGNSYSLHQRDVGEVCGNKLFETADVPFPSRPRLVQSSKCVDDDAEVTRLFRNLDSTSEALSHIFYIADKNLGLDIDSLTCAKGEEPGFQLCSGLSKVLDPDNPDDYISIGDLFGRACPGTCCKPGSIGCPTTCHLRRRAGTETSFGRISCMGHGCGKFNAQRDDRSGVLKIDLGKYEEDDGFNLAIQSDVALRLQFQKMKVGNDNDLLCTRAYLEIEGVKYCSGNIKPGSSDTVVLPRRTGGVTSIQWRTNIDSCMNERSEDCGITAVLMDAGQPTTYYVNVLGWSQVVAFERINSPRFKIFFFVVLYLWTGYVLIEISMSKHYMRFVLFCPSMPGSRLRRACTFLGVCVPRVLIAWWILAVGYILLRSTPDFIELVLNNAALAFVLEFDEILYGLAVPKKMKNEIAAMETHTWGAASCDPEHKFSRVWIIFKALLPIVFVIAFWLLQFSSDYWGLASINNQVQCSCLMQGSLCEDAVLD